MNKKALISIILILFIGLLCISFKNKSLILSKFSPSTDIQPESVIKNTSAVLHSNNNSFNYINQMLAKIKFKYAVLNLQNKDTEIGGEIEEIEKQIDENRAIIENDEMAYNNITDSLQKIDSSIDIAFYDLGIELDNGDFKTMDLTVASIDDNNINCINSDGTFLIDKSKIPMEIDINEGDILKVYYSNLTFSDNVGNFSTLFIEKL